MSVTETPEGTKLLTDEAMEYARLLQSAGFVIWVPRTDAPRPPLPKSGNGWFHYSRIVDGVRCFGTVTVSDHYKPGVEHRMPITPSKVDGSAIIVRGDGKEPPGPLTVEMAQRVARPSNFGLHFSTQKQFANAEPWGIGEEYVPLPLPGSPAE